MRKTLYSYWAAAVIVAGAFDVTSAYAASKAQILDIRNFVGTLEYKTSHNNSLRVGIRQGRKIKANSFGFAKGVVVTSNLGQLNNVSCHKQGNKIVLKINGNKYEPGDLPKITAVGSNLDGLRIKNSYVSANVGNIGGAAIDVNGCSNIVIGNIKHSLEVNGGGSGDFIARDIGENASINISGSGDVKVGKVGQNANINLAGSGDAKLGDIKGNAAIYKTGSGDIEIASAKALNIKSSGSGDIEVKGGKGTLNANMLGSGDIEYKGTAINPNISINGSGDAKIHATANN